jgi:Immunity protein 22
MGAVHVFVSTGRFRSFEEMRAFIDETYTGDGDSVASEFMKEVGLTNYEPGCIEAIHSKSGTALPVALLLAGASWGYTRNVCDKDRCFHGDTFRASLSSARLGA